MVKKNGFESQNVASGFLNVSVSCLNQMKDPVLIVCSGQLVHLGSQTQLSTPCVEGESPLLDMTCLPATMQQGSLPQKAA